MLSLATLLKYCKARDSSYALFRSTMATVHSEHWFWNLTQLSFIGAFGWDTLLPSVGGSIEVLGFFEHCLITQECGIAQNHPIEGFYALAFSADEGLGCDLWRSLTSPNRNSSTDSATLFVAVLHISSGDPQCSSFHISMSSCSRQIRRCSRVRNRPRLWSPVGPP